jgi:hypothetical protein
VRHLVTSDGFKWLLFVLAALLLNWPLLGIGSAVAGQLWQLVWLLAVWAVLIAVLVLVARSIGSIGATPGDRGPDEQRHDQSGPGAA